MKENKSFYIVWGVFFVALISINLIGQQLINHQGSIFFTGKWWSTWFPIYLVLFAFLAIGSNHNDK